MIPQDFVVFYSPQTQIDPELREKICRETVKLNKYSYEEFGDWKKNDMKNVCPLIQEWKIKELKLYENYQPQIIKDINQIQFPFLVQLHIGDNSIESIQGLNRVYLPALQKLYLGYNRISCVRDCKKANWIKLKLISFSGNNVQNDPILWMLGSPTLQTFYIEYFNETNEQYPDINWMMKMQTKCLEVLWIQSQHRIRSFSEEKMRRKQLSLAINPD